MVLCDVLFFLLALPRLRLRAQTEQMRVPSLHLGFDRLRYVFRSERSRLLTEHDLEGDVQQQIAEFGLDLIGIVSGECLVQLQRLLDEVGAQGGAGLHAIPRAPFSEISDELDDAPKR